MGQFDVAEFINNNSENKYTCTQLASEFNVNYSSMSVLLLKCINNGFIDRKILSVGFPNTYSYFAKV